MEEFDFIVIGGGSAGYAAARTAAGAGLKTAVIEGGETMGGLCILRGCMPSKTLLESAHRYRTLRRAGEFGLKADGISFDVAEIIARKNKLIGEFADYRRGQLEAGSFSLIRGLASFLDPWTLNIMPLDGTLSARSVKARSFLIATGSHISRPPVPGLDDPRCWTSDTVLDAEELPASLIVLGAGPVALELATYANDLECAVTIVQRSPQVLRGTDEDAAIALAAGLRDAGMTLHLGTRLLEIRHTGVGTAFVRFEQDGVEHAVEAARVLNALGRQPSLHGLESSNVRIENGRVAVAATQQTSQPHIFAAGDVCGPFEVVHVAIQQGEIAARNAARFLKGEGAGSWEQTDYRLKLFAVFSDPQFATVGASEAELTAAGRTFRMASYPFVDHGKSLVMGETHGLVKLLADAATGEILGGTVVGPEASELIHEIAVAMYFRAKAADLAAVPHYHPTLSEIWTYPAEELANPED